jgi:HSP20 family protein
MNRYQKIRGASAALLLGSILAVTPTFAAEPSEKTKGLGKEFAESIAKMQERMSQIFRDSLNKPHDQKSAYAASVDVREQPEKYIVRLHLPERDVSKVQVSLEGRTLKIDAEQGYEQSIVLRQARPNAKLDIDRQQHTLVVTVPKGGDLTADTKPLIPSLPPPAPDQWERDVLGRMEKMRREMDRVFEGAFDGLTFDTKSFFDKPEFGSSIDLQDEKDRYVVRAYLPGRDTQGADVKIEGQTLKISAQAEVRQRDESKSGLAETFNLSSYTQMLALPGPVDREKMKVDRKEGLLVITIPKKGA